MTTKFTEAQTCVFSKLYLSYRHLWDTQDEDYRSQQKRIETYREIASKFHQLTNVLLDQRDVGLKIKSLRSTYNLTIVKMRERPNYRPTLKWFPEWHKCLRDHVIRKGLLNEERDQDDYETETDNYATLEESLENVDTLHCESKSEENFDCGKDPFNNQSNDDYVVLVKQESDIMEEERTTRRLKSRKRKIKRDSFSSASESTIQPRFESQEDEFDIYGKYIATQLRGMGLERAIKAQLQIQNIVSGHRMNALKDVDK